MNQPVPQQPQQGQRSLAQLVANLGPISKVYETSKVDPRSLAAGIKPSFAAVTFKGKTWGIRYRGVTNQLLARDQHGNILGSIPTVDVVIIKSATAISKTYYIEKFKEGDFQAPDCWSTNGIKPDPAAPKKQNDLCMPCKWNRFGSRQMDDGRKGKACSDNKRVAVVPANDLKNEMFGGPMLLKLPPSSFAALSELETQLHMQGYRYDGLIIRLSFDHEAAFPKIVFTPVGVLDDHQAQEIVALQEHELVDRILSEELVEVTGDPEQPTAEAEQSTPIQQHHAEMMAQAEGRLHQQAQAFNPVAPPQPAPVTNVAPTAGFVAQPLPPVTHVPHVETKAPEVTGKAEPAVGETPEQIIARLQAELAASKESKPRRRRSSPVTPTGPQVSVEPTAHAGNGSAPETDEEEGDEPADLQSRIDALLKPPGGTAT